MSLTRKKLQAQVNELTVRLESMNPETRKALRARVAMLTKALADAKAELQKSNEIISELRLKNAEQAEEIRTLLASVETSEVSNA